MDQSAFLKATSEQTRALTARLEAAAERFDDSAWDRCPDGSWSPAGIVRHMVLANGPYLEALPPALAAGPKGSAAAITHTWFGAFLIKAAGPRSNAPAPKAMHPGPGPFGREVLTTWLGQQEAMGVLLELAREVDVCRVKFRNPFVPLFRMTAADALAVFATHTERHVVQIEARVQG